MHYLPKDFPFSTLFSIDFILRDKRCFEHIKSIFSNGANMLCGHLIYSFKTKIAVYARFNIRLALKRNGFLILIQ